MKYLKEHGYGGVIIWSLDLDDKTGDICKEGAFPLINAVKNELLDVPDQLPHINVECLDDNNTLIFENIHSKSTTILIMKSSKLQSIMTR